MRRGWSLVAVLFPVIPIAAGDVRFLPALELRAVHEGNVQNVGTGEADDSGRATLELGWRAVTPSIEWDGAYSPYHEAYRERSDLDLTGHVLHSSLRKRFSSSSSLYWLVDAARTTNRALDVVAPNQALSQLPRAQTDFGTLKLGGTQGVSPHSALTWGVEASAVHYADLPGLQLIDHRAGGVELGWGLRSRGGGTTGWVLSTQVYDYDERPDAHLQTLRGVFGRPLGTTGQVQLAAGASLLDQGPATERTNEPVFEASIEWRPRPLSVFSLGGSQSVGPGSGLGGPTLDRQAYMGWSRRPAHGLAAALTLGLTRREELEPGPATPTEPRDLELTDSLVWPVGRHVHLGAFHSYHDQRIDGGDPALTARYHSVGILLRIATLQAPRVPFTETPAGQALRERSEQATEPKPPETPEPPQGDSE